jgi:hypothetical protein
MKAIAVAALLFGVSLPASAAMPEQVQFVGSVHRDDLTPITFDLHLPSRQGVVLTLADGSTLELATPGSPASPDEARVRLVSPTGEVRHTATMPGPGLASTSFAYRICNGRVTYMSPAPAAIPRCGS